MNKIATKVITVLSLVLLFCFLGYGTTQSQQQKATKTFTIGVSAPLSGIAAVRGKYIKDGTGFAVKQINEAGGVGGFMLELKYEDNEGNPTKTTSTVEKLLKKEGVMALVVSDSTGTIASLPLVERGKVPMFTTAFSPSLTEKGNKYVFRSTVSDAITGAQVMDVAVKELGYKKVAILASDSDYGQGAAVAAAKELEKLGYPAVAIEKCQERDQDFSSQLLNIQKSGAEVLFIHSLDPAAALVTKQAREMGFTIPIIGATGLASEQYRDLAGADKVEGVYVIVAFANSDPDPMVQQFVKDFKAFAGYMADHNVARADAAIRLIAEALKKARSADPDKVAAALHQLKGIKAPGGTFTFDERGEGLKQNILGQWQKGKFEFIRRL
jgi:branched-chain amino acid transport system substrate-binding protein